MHAAPHRGSAQCSTGYALLQSDAPELNNVLLAAHSTADQSSAATS